MTTQKIFYFLTSAWKWALRKNMGCPSCGARHSTVVQNKYIVTSLRRCAACKLLFRCPTTTERENEKFYQSTYKQGFTTDMPAQSELHKMKANSFRGTEKDYTQYISVLKCLGLPPNASLLDYGCSWGYGSWQIAQAGFRVQGFEISRPRCAYAREFLEVDATWDTAELNGPFDVFFSAHVLEHVPSVSKTIDLASRLLRKGGFFVAFTPNGSKQYRRREPLRWKRAWGQVHPNFLDEVYYASRFQTYPYFIASSPYDEAALKDWVKEASSRREQRFGRLDGPELLIVVKY